MRSELGKECRRLFRKMMAEVFPEFQVDKSQVAPQGWYAWTRQHPSGLWFHVFLVIAPTRDEFTMEVAWSRTGKIEPYNDNDLEKFWSGPHKIRLSYLWGGTNFWWRLSPYPEPKWPSLEKEPPIAECLPLITPAVWDAAEKLKDFVLPAFEKITQKHGNSPASK